MALISLLSLSLPLAAVAQEDSPQILAIVESDSRLPLAQSILASMEKALGPEVTSSGDLYVEYLDILRFDDVESLGHMRAFLARRFGTVGIDAVAVLGPNALAFMLENRDSIAPGVPIVFGGIGESRLRQVLGTDAPADVTGVISPLDIAATVRLARQVQPDATEIIVVAGSAPFDRQWRTEAMNTFGDSYGGVPVRYLPEVTAAALKEMAAAFDPRQIVLLLSVNQDSAGERFLPIDFARDFSAASAAPVWTIYETQLGVGIAGGSVESLEATGHEMGRLLLGAMAGDPLPAPMTITPGPAVDWRVMLRHGLDPDFLPEETRVLFYDPRLWERYRTELLIVAAVILAQAATIAALVLERRRYLRTQETLAGERAQLIHISRNLRLGQLSAALAHELNQPLTAIQANADAGGRLVARTPPDITEIGAIFADITADTRRAVGIIHNLRRLMVKNETEFEEVDLNGVVRATVALAQTELSARGAQVVQRLAPDSLTVRGNGPQLQQVVLNLALNAAEAMNDLPEAERIVRIGSVRRDSTVCLTVEDAGPGVPPARREEVFKPFVSDKPTGLGIGLSICRNIVLAHGGTLGFVEPDGIGARAVLSLPALGSTT